MANLKEIRNRIASVSSTMQITNAMKMVSLPNLKGAGCITSTSYANKLSELIQNLATTAAEPTPMALYARCNRYQLFPYFQQRIVWGFNSNILKGTHELATQTYAGKEVKVLSIGKRQRVVGQANECIEHPR